MKRLRLYNGVCQTIWYICGAVTRITRIYFHSDKIRYILRVDTITTGEENRVVSETEKKVEDDIDHEDEISKLNYFLEETDELIRNKDYNEMVNLHKRADKIIGHYSTSRGTKTRFGCYSSGG